MKNILTIDCEEWYHTKTAQKYLSNQHKIPSEDRFANNILQLLNLLKEQKVQATFFMLGSLAEKYPQIINKIEGGGHTIGCHGYVHTDVFSLDKDEFEDHIKKATKTLKNLSAKRIISFRAPNWSINANCLWALDILKEQGYKYDSSFKNLKDLKKTPKNHGILEVPRSHLNFFNLSIPLGGAFLRIYPYTILSAMMRNLNANGYPFMVYLHPWEIDSNIPSLKTTPYDNFILYHNTGETHLLKVKSLLKDFNFTSLEKFFDQPRTNEESQHRLYYSL